jgi:hypothetical protein
MSQPFSSSSLFRGGGSSLALCFVGTTIDGFELKFVDIFYSNKSIYPYLGNSKRHLQSQGTAQENE